MRSQRSRESRCIACWPSATTAAEFATKVFCYVGGGWYFPGQTVQDLQDEMRRHLDAGYTMVKMKVGGLKLTEDVRRVEAVKTILPADAQLAVDANSKFGRDEALAYAKALAPFELRWFEEPCDPLDFALLAEIASRLRAPARDRREPLFDAGRAKISSASADCVRIATTSSRSIRRRPTASCNIARTVEMLERQGWPRSALFPHGGNQMSLAIAAGFGLGGAESYPGVFGAFGGFADDAQSGRRLSRAVRAARHRLRRPIGALFRSCASLRRDVRQPRDRTASECAVRLRLSRL